MGENSTDCLTASRAVKPPNSVCESCGREFVCGAKEKSCWCFEIEVAPELMTKLQKQFEGCICKECLVSPSRLLEATK